ncbi:hypothetical protein GIB67_005830 [Kingdonia uniflora]|uniref:Cytosolic endo-beta-N-acetylglucosaminidase TIM barrel domain-containing protein n=1 Tax=Kingdonia uniflora TaxID=39325 RepID=A0A7J7LUG2_9MAGN|nr:hypothetical protein GIB67_005830 [Kingdonia uniflora]
MNTKCVNTHEEVKKDASVHSKEPKEKKIKWKKLITSFMKSVLGTFIMEWDEGKVNVNKLLWAKEFAQMYAECLTELAAALGYDSVTKDGALSWQNQLNDKNKPFFDLCDGIFEGYPKLSATVTGEQKYDVYMLIDVFGRVTYGGGQWTGHCYHFSVDGGELSQDPWNNISHQSFQLVLEYSLDPTPKNIRAIADFKEALYSGGGNISFKGTLEVVLIV